MTRNEFLGSLLRALNLAVDAAEKRLGAPVPRDFIVELYAPDCPGRGVSLEKALDHLYVDGRHFYRIIDAAIRQVLPDVCVAFLRVSGHPPGDFDGTWDPAGLGPFKQMVADHVEDLRVHSG